MGCSESKVTSKADNPVQKKPTN